MGKGPRTDNAGNFFNHLKTINGAKENLKKLEKAIFVKYKGEKLLIISKSNRKNKSDKK